MCMVRTYTRDFEGPGGQCCSHTQNASSFINFQYTEQLQAGPESSENDLTYPIIWSDILNSTVQKLPRSVQTFARNGQKTENGR